jgi:4'-phosphopantetheinyl transferase
MAYDPAHFDHPAGFKRVDLWYAWQDQCLEADLLDEYRGLLTDDERRQELRLRFPGGREQFLLTRVLARTALSYYTGQDPASWRFVRGRWGKPAVDPASGPPLSFNLSNTAGLVVCGVTGGVELGIDAEDTRRRTDVEGLARRCLAPEELAGLRAEPPDRQADHFFRLWTLKEALLKAHGTGFSVGPEKFSIRLQAGQPPRLVDPGPLAQLIDVRPQAWQLAEIRLGSWHRAAVAVPLDGRQVQISIRATVPLRHQEPQSLLAKEPSRSWWVEKEDSGDGIQDTGCGAQ